MDKLYYHIFVCGDSEQRGNKVVWLYVLIPTYLNATSIPFFFTKLNELIYSSSSYMCYKIMHCDALGVQLTASVSIINSGLGLPGVPLPSTLILTVYVIPGFKSSILVCILLLLVLVTSLALINLLWPSVSHF